MRDARIAAALERRYREACSPRGHCWSPRRRTSTARPWLTWSRVGVLNPAFQRLASDALPMDRPLYLHQEQAIRKITAGRNVIVASGTGSGKTESFLVPILDALSAEQARGTLGPGVRALLLYPMNALANDQIKRLRQILAHVPAHHLRPVRRRHPRTAREAAEKFAVLNPGEPRLPNELLSRAEMRESAAAPAPDQLRHARVPAAAPADIDLFEGAARRALELHRRRRGPCLRRGEGGGARHAAPSAPRSGRRGTTAPLHRHQRDRRRRPPLGDRVRAAAVRRRLRVGAG